MKFEDINLLIISALYSKAVSLFKTQAEQRGTGRQAASEREGAANWGGIFWRFWRIFSQLEMTKVHEIQVQDRYYELWVIMSNK